jgi:hypothetical protein
MRHVFLLLALLYCGLAQAMEGICEEVEKNPLLTFDNPPYIITEMNDPEFVPLGTALTYTTKKYGHCDLGCANLGWHNAESLGEEWLYDRVKLTTGEVVGWSCGGEVSCKEPVRTHNVQCTIEVGDCDYQEVTDASPYMYFRIKRTFQVECLGDQSCEYENRPVTDCCHIVGGNLGVR